MASAQQGPALLPLQARTHRQRQPERAAPARRGARIRACRVAIRGDIAPARVSAPSSVQQNCRAEDRPLAAVFALLLRAAVEVQSTGARGPSHKKRVANTAPDSMTRANDRSSPSEPNNAKKTRIIEDSQGTPPLPHNCLREVKKSQNPYIFCRKLQLAPLGH